ncbi:MAG TPA: hypothetical protein PKJ95_04035, partial [Atribacterota bacterium]|nr:hypothetical protein [Atribacterota bacterium]
MIKEKVPDCRKSRTTLTQINYNTKYNPDEDIEEKPEEAPEDMSVRDFEPCRKTPVETCPDCSGQLEETTICGLDPQDTIDIFVCSRCSWKERRFIDDMTANEVLDLLE